MSLIDIGLIGRDKKSALLFFEAIMRPKAVVEGEVMLFFLFSPVLIDDSGVVFHFNA